MELEEFELLSKEPIYIEGIGNIKIPNLKDIRKIGHKTYEALRNYLSVDLQKYLDIKGIHEQYDSLSDDGKERNTLYNLIIYSEDFREVYKLIFSFFISENMKLNTETESFEFYKTETYEEVVNENVKINESKTVRFFSKLFKKIDILRLFNHKPDVIAIDKAITHEKQVLTGVINNDNFELVRDVLLQINKLKDSKSDNEPNKYKNDLARELVERMEKAAKVKQEKEKAKDDMNFGKMISKYCADNKNGINILNVWNMTIYQFYDQFMQHNYIRQSDIQDIVYANTVSFSDLKSYDSQLWLK